MAASNVYKELKILSMIPERKYMTITEEQKKPKREENENSED